jgi:hypothetical protein
MRTGATWFLLLACSAAFGCARSTPPTQNATASIENCSVRVGEVEYIDFDGDGLIDARADDDFHAFILVPTKGFLELGGQEKGGFRTVYDIDGVTYTFQPGGWRALPERAEAPAWKYEHGCDAVHVAVAARSTDSTSSASFQLGAYSYRDHDGDGVIDEANGPGGPIAVRIVPLSEPLVAP